MTDTTTSPFYDEHGVFHASCGCTLWWATGLIERPCGDYLNHTATKPLREAYLHERALREQQATTKKSLVVGPSDGEIDGEYCRQRESWVDHDSLGYTHMVWRAAVEWMRDQMRAGAAGYELGEPVRFDACPVGLFEYGGKLLLKTQRQIGGDAFTVSGWSWGTGVKPEVLASLEVRPVRGPLPIREPAVPVLDCEAEFEKWAAPRGLQTQSDAKVRVSWFGCFQHLVELGVIRAQVPEPVDPFEAWWVAHIVIRDEDYRRTAKLAARKAWAARGEAGT